ncbi:MAG TPA: MATE family efflux transporter [Polyangiaceae bacterium]|jgi:MATE family multidrug resistance protein|nr:MATE family efflux transporter [Polyangiaceae bacterium]
MSSTFSWPRTTTPTQRGDLRREAKALGRLALPLILVYAGYNVMGLVDTVIVGRLKASALGAVGIGNGIFNALALVGLGAVLGVDPIAAQAMGAGDEAGARQALRAGLRVAWLVGIPITLLVIGTSFMLAPLGVEPVTAHDAMLFLLARVTNPMSFALFGAYRSFLQVKGVTRPVVIGMVLSNVTNVIGNLLFIYGDEGLTAVGLPAVGLPPLGVFGCGLSTALSSLLSVAIVGAAARRLMPHAAQPKGSSSSREPPPSRELVVKVLKLGLPMGLQNLAEVGLFALVAVLAGRISAEAAAAHQIAIALASFTFCVTAGIGAATSVRVGHHVGAGNTAGARRAGFLGIALAAIIMGSFGTAFLLAPGLFTRMLTSDPAVIPLGMALLYVAALFQVSDGIQAVALGALRGAGDTRVGLIANLIGYYLLGLPVAYYWGVVRGGGVIGLWWGLSAGLTGVAVGLSYRFHSISRRQLQRV